MKLVGTPVPEATLAAIREYGVAIKGPLGTPTGGGMRSLNVAMRKYFDLYQCVRPVRWYPGVPSPVVRPQDLDVVIFRENTEDIYAGIEMVAGSPEAKRVIDLLHEMKFEVRDDSAIGIKPISQLRRSASSGKRSSTPSSTTARLSPSSARATFRNSLKAPLLPGLSKWRKKSIAT